MIITTGFLLGLIGSLHCAGMCGPLVLALPKTAGARSGDLFGKLLYNGGRILTYCILGALFGMLGQSLVFAGVQRWLSLGAGAIILIGLLVSMRYQLSAPATFILSRVKSGMGRALRQRTRSSLFALGFLNGFLPCGLVYVACAGAVAAGGFIPSISYMLLFGLGTLPMMLGLALAGGGLQAAIRLRFQKWIPAGVCCVALLLIVRGLSLGIPYLSPDLTLPNTACH